MKNKEKVFDLIEDMFLYIGVLLLINVVASTIISLGTGANPISLLDLFMFAEIGLFLIFGGCILSGELKKEHRGESLPTEKYSQGVKYIILSGLLFVLEVIIDIFFY